MDQPAVLPFSDDNTGYLFSFHFCAQFLISLIAMNLIIALINDSINTFLSNKECKKYRLANQMILDTERSAPYFDIG